VICITGVLNDEENEGEAEFADKSRHTQGRKLSSEAHQKKRVVRIRSASGKKRRWSRLGMLWRKKDTHIRITPKGGMEADVEKKKEKKEDPKREEEKREAYKRYLTPCTAGACWASRSGRRAEGKKEGE